MEYRMHGLICYNYYYHYLGGRIPMSGDRSLSPVTDRSY